MKLYPHLLLSEALNLLVVLVKLVLKHLHLPFHLVLGVLTPVHDAALTQLKHSLDVLWPVEHGAVQLDVLIYKHQYLTTGDTVSRGAGHIIWVGEGGNQK